MITKQSDLRWLVFVLLTVSNLQCCVFGKQQQQQEQVPCYFIFGDSFAVNGNDNDLDTYKANYLPYGSDFPAGPTGRFSNGKTMVDVLAEKVGLKDYIPPFRKVGNGTEILKGVNYASGAAIMQVETAGSKVTSISQQINFHRTIVRRIDNIFGSKFKSNYYLQQCLYSVGIGSNDYLVGYYTPSNNGSEPTRKIPSEEYAEKLVDGYLFNHLNNLYNSGARKIAIFGLGPLGCSPTAVKFYATNQHCISVMDTDIHIFNSRISMVVDRFNKNCKNAKFTYINIYDLTSANVFPGFKQTQVPCCETDRNGLCAPNTAKCQNVNDYFYWDGYRPTEAANVVLANLAYNASVPDNAYPYNLQQLIA